jgi:diacylglycerol kinase family enzyme
LAGGTRRKLDVGFVQGGDYPQGRYFGNGVGIGFDAVVGFEALKLKRLSGFPSYIVAALKTIFLYFKAPTVRIEFGDQVLTQPALMVSIMNGRRMGGGFMMAPEGLTDDGLFDLCIAGQVSKLGIFGLIPRFMQGTQSGHPAIRTARTDKITVTAVQGSLPAHADGETLCIAGERLDLYILPALLEVIAPKIP